ncbi:MAG: type VI secretion system contractile sheath large subunit [Bryobacteraceae bacterium]|nr:type VI secretion system contractile sheath large subunit [Bryobacteraceae bacterium]MDW8376962.1 type VI secretion system contractile sheath large subunit [Bryobacterales bacterium]
MASTSYADVQLDVETGASGDRPKPKRQLETGKPHPNTPFRILVLGDFSGRASRHIVDRGPRKAVAVDQDNFERVFQQLQVQLRLPLQDAPPLELTFREWDDFHPDRLFFKAPLFAKLRQLREELDDPHRFREIARDLGLSEPAAKAQPAAEPDPPASRPGLGEVLGGSLLEQAMEATEARLPNAPTRRGSSDPLQQYIEALVKPYLVAKPDARRAQLLEQLDNALRSAMCSLLHHPNFQQLEANWRALDWMLRQLETGPRLKVFLVDISREELEADLSSAEDLRQTAMYRLLVEQTVRTPGADPWAVIVAAFTFGPDMADLNLLGRLGLLARQAGAPVLSGGSPQLVGCESFAKTPYPEDWDASKQREGWDLIRSLPEARYLGLVVPRFMARRPYGKHSESTEAFEFEEILLKPGEKPNHEHFLWANSAFLCACLLGQSFAEDGWNFDPNRLLEIRGLPYFVFSHQGEIVMTPPAEVTLTQTAMEKILDSGLMVLMSYVGGDQVRLAGFRSVAHGPAGLSGRWV